MDQDVIFCEMGLRLNLQYGRDPADSAFELISSHPNRAVICDCFIASGYLGSCLILVYRRNAQIDKGGFHSSSWFISSQLTAKRDTSVTKEATSRATAGEFLRTNPLKPSPCPQNRQREGQRFLDGRTLLLRQIRHRTVSAYMVLRLQISY